MAFVMTNSAGATGPSVLEGAALGAPKILRSVPELRTICGTKLVHVSSLSAAKPFIIPPTTHPCKKGFLGAAVLMHLRGRTRAFVVSPRL